MRQYFGTCQHHEDIATGRRLVFAAAIVGSLIVIALMLYAIDTAPLSAVLGP